MFNNTLEEMECQDAISALIKNSKQA